MESLPINSSQNILQWRDHHLILSKHGRLLLNLTEVSVIINSFRIYSLTTNSKVNPKTQIHNIVAKNQTHYTPWNNISNYQSSNKRNYPNNTIHPSKDKISLTSNPTELISSSKPTHWRARVPLSTLVTKTSEETLNLAKTWSIEKFIN